CRKRSVAQNSAGMTDATSGLGQFVHMTTNPEPANAAPANTPGTFPVPRRRHNRYVQPTATSIWPSLAAAGASARGRATYSRPKGLNDPDAEWDADAVPPAG